MLSEKIANHIEKVGYDQVILTQFCRTELWADEDYYPVADLIDKVYEYGYGWAVEGFARNNKHHKQIVSAIDSKGEYKLENGALVVHGNNHSDIVFIDTWMLNLPKQDVNICGAFSGECLSDLETALTHLNIDYDKVYELIL